MILIFFCFDTKEANPPRRTRLTLCLAKNKFHFVQGNILVPARGGTSNSIFLQLSTTLHFLNAAHCRSFNY